MQPNDSTHTRAYPGWEALDILVLGADAGDRARVRQVLREARILALTDDDPALQIRVAVNEGRLGSVHVGGVQLADSQEGAGGEEGDAEDDAENAAEGVVEVAPGITMDELRERLAAAAPEALIFDGSEVDVDEAGAEAGAGEARTEAGAGAGGQPSTAEASDVERMQAAVARVAAERASETDEDERYIPSLILTDSEEPDIVEEAQRTGLAIAVAPVEDADGMTLLAYRAPFGQGVWVGGTSVSLAAEDLTRGVDLQLLTPEQDAQWSPGVLTPVDLPGVDVHSGELAEFIEQAVGVGAVAGAVAGALAACGHEVEAAELHRAMQAPASRQAPLLVEALGLPAAAVRLLRGEITPEAFVAEVPGSRLVEADDAAVPAFETIPDATSVTQKEIYVTEKTGSELLNEFIQCFVDELSKSESGRGIFGLYRRIAVDEPDLLNRVVAAEAGLGAILAGCSLRKAARGKGGRGNKLRGILGALLLIDAVAEVYWARTVRDRLDQE